MPAKTAATGARSPEDVEMCGHPRTLALTLGAHQDQSWEDSIRQVVSLLNQAATSASQTGGRVFKASEVPEFKDSADYWNWRCQFRRFALSQDVPTGSLSQALNRVLQQFTGPNTSPLAQSWNIATTLGDAYTWDQAWQALIDKTDVNYLPQDIYSRQIRNWNSTRPKPGDSPQDFLVRFRANLWTLEEAAILKNVPPPAGAEVMRQFMRVIPDHLRNECVKLIPNLEAGPLDAHAPRILEIWATTPSPTAARPPRAASAPIQGRPAPRTTNNEKRLRRCGVNCSYDEPAPRVPDEYRGALYWKATADPAANFQAQNRNTRARGANLCESCRRPRDYHRAGQTFMPIRDYRAGPLPAAPRVNFAPINGPRVEDLGEQLALPAPNLE